METEITDLDAHVDWDAISEDINDIYEEAREIPDRDRSSRVGEMLSDLIADHLTEKGLSWDEEAFALYLWDVQRDLEDQWDRFPPYQDDGIPAQTIDLLQAIFAVTREAKRQRDTAQEHHQCKRYRFSTECKEMKDYLYWLKDAGIVAAVRAGRVQAVAAFNDLTVYRGEGYYYHSFLRPIGYLGEVATTDKEIRVEAKPRGINEPRIKDAIFTLRSLDAKVDTSEFQCLKKERDDKDDFEETREDEDDEGYEYE